MSMDIEIEHEFQAIFTSIEDAVSSAESLHQAKTLEEIERFLAEIREAVEMTQGFIVSWEPTPATQPNE